MIWTTRQRSDVGALSAIVAGKGPLVVLIHGVGLRSEAWATQIDHLAKDHRVFAVDMPGHGHSARLSNEPQLADYTDAIAATFDEAAIVIGHSFGAMIALDIAIRHPHKVTGVAALNAIFRRGVQAAAAVQARAQSLDGVHTANPDAPLVRWFGEKDSPEKMACHRWLSNVDPKGYRAAYGVFAREDGPADDALDSLSVPALFLTGALEPNSLPEMSHAMATRAPRGCAEIVAGAAHMLPMTHPDAVNGILTEFIQRATPPQTART